jgi:Tol biopolymer transport system component
MTNHAAALDELCPDDEDVRREVESLIEAREQAAGFLSRSDFENQVGDLFCEQDLVGQKLGPYSVTAAVGAGAMGEVYLAQDTRLDRRVALKIMPARFTRDGARVARFRREAKAASALNHPNIITIYEIGEIDGTWFIAAEFIDGMTVRELFGRRELPLSEVLDVSLQCARALEAAHEAGIVHRDVKPENIMLRPDGLVKVVDFGLARINTRTSESATEATQTGSLVGTPRYMSPEQARGENLDARTDIFSLGAVVYEMATGKHAFPGSTTADVFAALLGSTPSPPSKCAGRVPEQLDEIIQKALQKDRAARYQTMRQFAADLEELKQSAPHETRVVRNSGAQARTASSERSRRKRLGLMLAAAIVLASLLVVWYVRSSQTSNRANTAPLTLVPLTSFEGHKDFASFSPDGKQIAFSWNGGSRPERDIYVMTIGRGDPVRLTFSQADDRLPVWSPEGRSIAFCRPVVAEPTPSQYGIYIVPASGGHERKIADGGVGVSWSPDGKVLAIAGSQSEGGGIFLLSLDGNSRRQLTNPDSAVDSLPVFSKDGKSIAFTRDFGFSAREIFAVPARGGTTRQLTFDRQPTYGATWTADNREIVFASNRGVGGESLWRIAATGGTPKAVSAMLQGSFYPAIPQQGNRLAYTESMTNTNIYTLDGPGFGNRPVLDRFGPLRSFITSSRRDDSPSISPDGQRIAFVSKRTGNEEIWLSDRTGSRLKRLTSFAGPGTGTPRWSPDGRTIAFDSLAAGNPNIYVVNADGGEPRRLTSWPWSNFMPSWSPDGKWIYFKTDRSGSDQIWKIPAAGGDPKQVTSGGGCEAFASPDGKLLYFTKRAWSAIWTVPVGGGPEKPLPELERFDRVFRSWGISAKGIYFISREDAPHQTVRFFSFATRQTTSLATLDREPIWDYPDVALSPDGRQLLIATLDQEFNDLMLIENFH